MSRALVESHVQPNNVSRVAEKLCCVCGASHGLAIYGEERVARLDDASGRCPRMDNIDNDIAVAVFLYEDNAHFDDPWPLVKLDKRRCHVRRCNIVVVVVVCHSACCMRSCMS